MTVSRDGGRQLTAPQVTCGSCGAPTSSTGKFCSECGTRLAPASHSAEYKQVTVLFADVVRSLDLASALDIERLRDVMNDLVERCSAVARRYGGGRVEYTGDGLMVLFGAPVALEDHAIRACLAALAIQEEAHGLALEVFDRDGVTLQLRLGVSSGRVIAGEAGTESARYAATGGTIGFAHRLQSVAPPGGVILSESTARLVEHTVVLGDPEWVHVKGVEDPVRTHRLLSIDRGHHLARRTEASLIGRRWETAALDAMLERAVDRRGGVVNVVGAPGIGKSRLAREVAAMADRRGMQVTWGFCESHARDVPFHAVSRLLRASTGVTDLDNRAAREKVRQQMPNADPQDLLLLDDLLGIADPGAQLPEVDAVTRRQRLTALINTRTLTRSEPTLFVIEDAHWIDAISESMLVDFLAVIPRTPSMVLITSRPEYDGALLRVPGAQAIALDPLQDSDIAALLDELVGSHPTISDLLRTIAERAAGNPFFAEEMVREMIQRGVLVGERGCYTCRADIADVSVPATVVAAIDARIDRLGATARRTLQAASVIGARFGAELLNALGVNEYIDELLAAELLDQVRFGPTAEYAFRHPLIRAVAYESQLKSERAGWHRRLAAAIQELASGSVDENAALIAEHLEAAGDLHSAYDWHMRSGAWSTNRDLAAARMSWERACRIADGIPDDDPDQLSMGIAPRTMLCGTDLQAREIGQSQARFAKLRDLCEAAGDKVSLAIGMSGPITETMFSGHPQESARLASQQMALLASIEDPTPAMGLAPIAFCSWLGVCDFAEILRWSQTIVDLADGDPVKGAGYGVGSPLAIALAWRGTARWCLGRPGWRQDLHDGVSLARRSNAETFSGAIAWSYGFAMQFGVLRADDSLVDACVDAMQTACEAGNDRGKGLAGSTLAVWLLRQDSLADRDHGVEVLRQTRELWSRWRAVFIVPVIDMWAAAETARRGDRDTALPMMRRALRELRERFPFYAVWGTGVLVETLLERVAPGDLAEAQDALSWLEGFAAEHTSAATDIAVLRARTLLARARGDLNSFRESVACYREMAKSLGFEGHFAWAEAIAAGV